MRSEEEIRTVARGLLREAIDPPKNAGAREGERCGIALGILLWVLGFDTDEIRAKLLSNFDKFGGR